MNSISTALPEIDLPREAQPARTPAWQLFARRHARVATALLLLAVVMFPILWLVQLALRPAADIFADELLFTPTLESFAGLLQGNLQWKGRLIENTTGLLLPFVPAPGQRWRRGC
jgi:ABC-type glycerol-3-phosphate transport system permease component